MPAAAGPAVLVERLERRYGSHRGPGLKAVDGLDLQVEAGEVYGFLGPNGAGKTTLVRILTTLLRPTGGRALVAGHDVVKEAGAVRRNIGVALQEAALDPLMTGRELLRLQGALHGLRRKDAKARGEELLERVELTDVGDRRLQTYSGGMRRRLDLALALVHRPEVLFLDEPTTGLDPPSRAGLWREVRALNAEGTTTFLTTQYLEEAEQLAGRVGIIARGKLVAEGTPAELKARVGEPALVLELSDVGQAAAARELVGRFGTVECGEDGLVRLRTARGGGAVADVVRALDDGGVGVAGFSVESPSLDDVFLSVTGRAVAEDEAARARDAAAEDGDPDADAQAEAVGAR